MCNEGVVELKACNIWVRSLWWFVMPHWRTTWQIYLRNHNEAFSDQRLLIMIWHHVKQFKREFDDTEIKYPDTNNINFDMDFSQSIEKVWQWLVASIEKIVGKSLSSSIPKNGLFIYNLFTLSIFIHWTLHKKIRWSVVRLSSNGWVIFNVQKISLKCQHCWSGHQVT